MNPITIFITPTKRRQRAETFNTAIPGIVLLITGVDEFLEGNASLAWTPYLNIFAGIAVLIAMIVESRRKASHGDALVNFVDIFAGIVLVVQGVNVRHPGKVVQPAIAYFLIGLGTIAKGIFHSSLPKIRRLSIDNQGFMLRTSPFRKVQIAWKNISSIQSAGSRVRITTQDGKSHAIGLQRIGNKDEITSTLIDQAARRGIAIDR